MRTLARLHSESPAHPTPAKQFLYMPLVAFHPLPVLQEGEGLEIEENENEVNDGVTITFVNGEDSWTLVQRRNKNKQKKDNKIEKWNKQQRENFLQFGDIY